jgi:hypothetical protein
MSRSRNENTAKQERHKGRTYGEPHKAGKELGHRRHRRIARERARTLKVEEV